MDAERFERIKHILATLDAMPVPDRASRSILMQAGRGVDCGLRPDRIRGTPVCTENHVRE